MRTFTHICKMAEKEEAAAATSDEGFLTSFLTELLTSPLNLFLLAVCGYLIYKIFLGKRSSQPPPPRQPELPPLKKRDFTLEQLREFDGKGKDGRLMMAVNGKCFDVTRGKRFYGPGMRLPVVVMMFIY